MTTEIVKPATQLAALKEKVEELKLARQVQVLESTINNTAEAESFVESWGDFVSPRELFDSRDDAFPQQQLGYTMSRPSDRANGDNFPLWRSEQDCSRIRGICRFLGQMSTSAIGCLVALRSYVIGVGLKIKVSGKQPEDATPEQKIADNPNDKIAAAVQKVIDDTFTANRWNTILERELFVRARRDGEYFLRVCGDTFGRTTFEVYEPEWITEPINARQIEYYYGLDDAHGYPLLDWKYGVCSVAGEPTKIIGYFGIRNGDATRGEFIPAADMLQVKCNVDDNVKRGCSDFFPGHGWVESAAGLLGRTISAATLQAGIALFRKYNPKVRNSSIQAASDANVDFTTVGGGNAGPVRTEKFGDSLVVDGKGFDLEPGVMGQSNAPVFVDLYQAGERAFRQRWVMPEFFTGDASNNNRNSSITAHDPFVIECQSEQNIHVEIKKKIAWKIVDNACMAGRLEYDPQEIRQLIDISAEPPDITPEDDAQNHAIRKDQNAAGILSKHTWAQMENLDYDEQRALIDSEPKDEPVAAPGDPFGGKGDPESRAAARATQLSLTESQTLADRCLTLLVADLTEEDDGHWVTINGEHVEIGGDGKIMTGPMKGQTIGDKHGGGEGGATAIFQGEKFRVASPRARLNIDQMTDMMKERGYSVGKPEVNLKLGATLYPIEGHGKKLLMPAKQIGKFLSTEKHTIS